MKLEHSFLPAAGLVSTAFVRWQGAFAEVSSLDLAVSVGRSSLTRLGLPATALGSLVFGWTIPQPAIFYGAPWVAARIGAPGISGPMVSQACATAVASLQAAALQVEAGGGVIGARSSTTSSATTSATSEAASRATAGNGSDIASGILVLTADRTSNGPSLAYPAPSSGGGAPVIEHWVLDNFKRDPWTSEAMIATAEHVARECGASRDEIDDLTQMRYEQYSSALADDRRLQRRYMVDVELPGPKRSVTRIAEDAGIHHTSRDGLRALKPVLPDGVMTYGSQTHPADGAAAALVCGPAQARELAAGGPVVRMLATGFARAERARMPKAATSAAQAALADAGLTIADVDCVTTHNPFAVNDLWFARQTGYALDKMNPLGCSLVYGHPQAPTGLRAIAELVTALVERGGGVGLFTGCAAGDTGGALVLEVTG